jgi:outer membrane protein assembly factor BamB
MVVGFRDDGEHGDVVWRRDDVNALCTTSQAGADIGYTVIRSGDKGLALFVFRTADGRTVNTYPLPQATGWPVGVSVAVDRRVITGTSDGQVYGFDPV